MISVTVESDKVFLKELSVMENGRRIKNVLITGGSRGIGAACAALFAREGYSVFVNYVRDDEAAEDVASETGAVLIKGDISRHEDILRIAREMEAHGGADVLVNNAGTACRKMFQDVNEEEYDRLFGVNMRGMFFMTQAIIRGMINRKYGRIINVSSMWGISGGSCEVHYSASKAAVIGFTKALAKELGPSGITVNCIAPGVIDTDMNRDLDSDALEELRNETPVMRLGTPEDVAAAALFFASENAGFITGQVLGVDGGII